jgi:uncharacterized membrane protein
MESRRRSAYKSVSWYMVNIAMVAVVSYFFVGNWITAVALSLTQTLLESIIYYGHERAWTTVGRKVK